MLCLYSKTYSCYDSKSNKFKISSKFLNKRLLEDSVDGPMAQYRRALNEAVNLTNRGFRSVNHKVASFGSTIK